MTDAAQLPHAQHVAQRGAVVRGAARGGFRKRQCRAVDGEHRVHAESVGGHRVVRDAADDGDDGDAPLCAAGDAADDLAAQALAVEPPLAGDDEVGALEQAVKPREIEQRLDAGRRVPPSSAMHPKPKPPAVPAPGHIREVAPRFGIDDLAQAVQPPVEQADGSPRPRPFCGPNTAAAPSGPQRGLSTSHMAVIFTPASSSRAPERSMRRICASVPP